MKDQWKSEFAARFSRHEDELKWLYYELYHSNGQAFDAFTDMMYRLWEERPEKLLEEIGRAHGLNSSHPTTSRMPSSA